jgi:hypothetical protein
MPRTTPDSRQKTAGGSPNPLGGTPAVISRRRALDQPVGARSRAPGVRSIQRGLLVTGRDWIAENRPAKLTAEAQAKGLPDGAEVRAPSPRASCASPDGASTRPRRVPGSPPVAMPEASAATASRPPRPGPSCATRWVTWTAPVGLRNKADSLQVPDISEARDGPRRPVEAGRLGGTGIATTGPERGPLTRPLYRPPGARRSTR